MRGIEMQAVNEYNLPKRMRYYQAAVDILFLDKGEYYSNLNDSCIIFLCLFDSIGKNKPVYTFENICLEDRKTPLNDGTKKIIINANAFKKAKDKNLSRFLEYIKTGKVSDEFTGRIEKMIEQVKKTPNKPEANTVLCPPLKWMPAITVGKKAEVKTCRQVLLKVFPTGRGKQNWKRFN